MKSKQKPGRLSGFLPYSLRLGFLAATIAPAAHAQSQWSGGGSDTNWSTELNWDLLPLDGESLIFDGTAGLSNVNDFMTALDSTGTAPAVTFALDAGSFLIDDDGVVSPIVIGLGGEGAADTVFVSQESPNAQEIAHDIKLIGGGKYRDISFLDPTPPEQEPGTVAPGDLTLSGTVDFSNDWLRILNGPGTLILSGDNIGPGAPNKVNGNENNMRSTLLANVGGASLVLGSPTALGASTSSLGTPGQLIGININQTSTLSSTMDLTGANMVDNTIAYNGSVNYESEFDLEITGLINTATNGRGITPIGPGGLIISGDGYYITSRTTGQLGILQGTGGNITLNGNLHDTFQSGGITTLAQGVAGLTPSHFRKQGTNTLFINSDNSETFNGEMRHRSGTVVLGHEYALGPNGGPDFDLPGNTATGSTTLEMADADRVIIGQTVTGAGIPADTTVVSVDRSGGPAFERPVNTYAGDPIIDVDDPTGILPGQPVTGEGIPDGATVVNVDTDGVPAFVTLSENATADAQGVIATFSGSTDSVELSLAATADASDVSLNFSGTEDLIVARPTAVLDSNVITVPDATGIGVGFWVGGRTFDAGTTVLAIDTAVDPIEITLSKPSKGDAPANRDMVFGRPGPSQVEGPATLDLNGLVIGELFSSGFGGTIINSDTENPAALTKQITGSGWITIDGEGDISLDSYSQNYASVTRNLTKNGICTLTIGGNVTNTRFGLIVNAGNVDIAKTGGNALTRNLQMNTGAGTVRITAGANNAIHDAWHIVVDDGVFDLNGFDETIGGIEALATGGQVTNNGTSSATLTIGGATDRSFAGDIIAGSAVLNLVKSGVFIQTLTGANTYTGNTTINAGVLSLSTATLADAADVSIAEFDAFLDLTHGLTDTVARLIIEGVSQPVGVYGAIDSGAEFEIPQITGSGLLNVTSAGSDYDDWASSYPSLGGPTEDDDKDSLLNEDEYAFGLDPTSGSSLNPYVVPFDPAVGTFSYSRRKPSLTGLSYSYSASTDLAVWEPFTPASVESDGGDPTEIITIEVPADLLESGALFIRTTGE